MAQPPILVNSPGASSNYEIGHVTDLVVASEPARRGGRFELGRECRGERRVGLS
jgi:hypothetical protein